VTKDLSNQPKSGRKRITTKKQDQKIFELAQKKDNVTAMQISEDMKKYNVKVSKVTIRCHLREQGATFGPQLSKPLLTDKHLKKRLEWAKSIGTMTGTMFFFRRKYLLPEIPAKKSVAVP